MIILESIFESKKKLTSSEKKLFSQMKSYMSGVISLKKGMTKTTDLKYLGLEDFIMTHGQVLQGAFTALVADRAI